MRLPDYRVNLPNVNNFFQPVQQALQGYVHGMDRQTARNDMLDQRDYQRSQDAAQMAFRQEQAAEQRAYRDKAFNADQDYRAKQLGFSQSQDARAAESHSSLMAQRKAELQKQQLQQAAGLAQMIQQEPDPARRQAMWQQMLQSDPGLASSVSGMDVDQGTAWVIGNARGYVEPRNAVPVNRQTPQEREALAVQYGIDPESPEGRSFILTGKLPMPKARSKDPAQQAQNISAGLTQLAGVPQYAGNSFENAVGPIQGDDEGGILTGISRAYGAVRNALGGDSSTTEIRSRIRGDTEALAAAIKPLIRAPGEGPWTDADQRRLVAVVGDLALAKDVPDYNRRLEAIRQRVRANFGIDLPPIPGVTPPPKTDNPAGDLPAGWSVRKID